jgi:hypothetical protein
MFPFVCGRCIIVRYLIIWTFLLTLIKLTSISYYGLQQNLAETNPSPVSFEPKMIHHSHRLTSRDVPNIEIGPTNKITRRDGTWIDMHRLYIQRQNQLQHMHNAHLFSSATMHYVLLVQVHKRIAYLTQFIEMLRAVDTINQTLVIFSHDFIDANINRLIANIDFVPVDDSIVVQDSCAIDIVRVSTRRYKSSIHFLSKSIRTNFPVLIPTIVPVTFLDSSQLTYEHKPTLYKCQQNTDRVSCHSIVERWQVDVTMRSIPINTVTIEKQRSYKSNTIGGGK